MRRCKICLLPETYPNISFTNGICSYCLGKTHFGVEDDEEIKKLIEKKGQLKKEFEEFIKKTKGENDYDCLLLFSGGKDSTYLLYLLKEKYKLNPLALSVDTGFMNHLAKRNIKKIIKKLKVDNIFFTPGNAFFKKLYRYYLLNPGSETYCDKICGICSEVIHGIGLIEASNRKIPCIILANSPDQTDHYFFEIPKEKISKSWVPKEFNNNYFSKEEISHFWNPKEMDYIPRFFLPFHVINYPGEQAIIEELSKLNLLKKNKLSPVKTNCDLVWLLHYLDLNNKGYTPYIKNLSREIQNGKFHCNKLKKMYYTLGIKLIKSDFLKRWEKKYVLDYLDLKIKDLIKKIG